MSRLGAFATVAGLALVGLAAQAKEIYVQGRVLDVAPVYGSRTVVVPPADCPETRQPSPGAGLVALLRWDLAPECSNVRRTEQTVTGYRVRYEWEDRVYSSILAEPPGDTVTLRLRVR